MHIQIVDTSVSARTIKSVKTGQLMEFREQAGIAVFSAHHMVPVRVPLGREDAALAAGRYALDGASFVVSKYGDLALGRIKLVALASGSAPESSAATARKAG